MIVSGCVAAYKSLDLIRRLREQGAEVRCVLTKGGEKFVTPLSIEALSGQTVLRDLWTENGTMPHIAASRWADLVVIAPASANLLARMAHGLADDLASTMILASNKPLLAAPGMNVEMWRNPATQANVATLVERGAMFVGPGCGRLACGEEGQGRMAEVDEILSAIAEFFAARRGALSGLRALVTSGPTYEPLDPVRFLGNRSSGKQGHAIAAALAEAGAEVALVTGPVAIADPQVARVIRVETAAEMLAACRREIGASPVDVAICAAAVADWRPREVSPAKIKKNGATSSGSAPPSIALAENPDILAELSQASPARPRLVIGFAAETENVEANAAAKFARKGCDWIIANDVSGGKVFGGDENKAVLMRRETSGKINSTRWPSQSKTALAEKLAAEIGKFLAKSGR